MKVPLIFLCLFFIISLFSCTATQIYCSHCTPQYNIKSIHSRSLDSLAFLKKERTVSWKMQNILFSSSDRSLNRFKDFDESTMDVTSTLYDDLLIGCMLDSIAQQDTSSYATLLHKYQEKHNSNEYIRIQVTLTTYFSRKSIENELWTIYLVDENGDMYESERVVFGSITEQSSSGKYRDKTLSRSHYQSVIDLYFKRITFYGQDLISLDRKYLKLVFAYKRKIIGAGGWCFRSELK